jgi:NitT/TauT family transport system substrate-binding protein
MSHDRGAGMGWVSLVLTCLVVVAAVALGWTGAAGAADKAVFRLEWRLTGYHAAYWYAKEKGFYEAEGIDLDIRWGDGSGKTLTSIAANTEDFGQCDGVIAAAGISQGMPVKSIYAVTQKSTWVIVSYKDKPISKPQDLVGKSLSTIASHVKVLQLFFRLNKIPEDQVTLQVVAAGVRNTLFRQGKVDGTMGIYDGRTLDFHFLAEEGKVKPVTWLRLNEWGYKAVGQMIIANESTLQKKPDLVRRFVRATARGWKESMKPENVDEAVRIAIKHSPNETQTLDGVKAQFQNSWSVLHTEHSKGKPLGWMAAEDWQATLDAMKEMEMVDKVRPVGEYYTNEFVPSN